MKRVGYDVEVFSGTATSTSNTQSTSINTRYVEEAIFSLDITAASGTSPTLDITIQTYDQFADVWQTLATFTQKTTTGSDAGFVGDCIGNELAILYTIGGTTPSFTFSVNAMLK